MRLLPRRRRLAWIVLGLIAAPALGWAIILTLVPTEWARALVVRRLVDATGRSVRVQRLRLGMLGGLHLEGLEVGERDNPADPWLKARSIVVDVHLPQLLARCVQPTTLSAEGVTLRVKRKASGELEFADLFRAGPTSGTASDGPARGEAPCVEFRLSDARLLMVDDRAGTRLELVELEGRGTWSKQLATLTELRGRLNGGTLEASASLDRGPGGPMFEGQLRLQDVDLGPHMRALSYLVPVVAGTTKALEGKLGLNFYVRGQGDTHDELSRSLAGQGTIELDPVTHADSRLLDELDGIVDLPKGARVGSLRGDLALGDGRVSSQNLTLRVGPVPIVLSGWTAFDGRLNYRLKADALTPRIPPEAKGFLAELQGAVDEFLPTRIEGTVDHLVLTVDGVPLHAKRGGAGRPAMDDKAKLRAIGRRLKDKLLR